MPNCSDCYLSIKLEQLKKEHRRVELLAKDVARMSSIMAHEIRNPLAGIKAIIHSIMEDAAKIGLDYAMEMISEEIDRLNELLNEYSQIMRKKGPQHVMTDFNDIIESVRVSCGRRLGKRTLEVDLHGLSSICVNPAQMKQLLLNLLLNSIDATSDDDVIQIHARIEDSHLIIEVRDTGHGIQEEHLGRITEAFYTTKPHGTGLGLAVCSQIVKEHNGTLDIRSCVGQGTSVKITLPLLQPT